MPKPFQNSGWEEISGTSFHYRLYPPAGNAVKGKALLIHGLGGSTFSFERTAPLIAGAGYCVVSADLPGFGYSGRNPGYDHAQANRARDLWTLLEIVDSRLEPDLAAAPWLLTGHSMGGGTAAAMAISAPERVKGLILIAPALSGREGGSPLLGFPPAARLLQVALERVLITPGGVRRFLASAYGREPSPEEVAGYLAPLQLPGTARAATGLFQGTDRFDPAALKNVPAPILAVWGSEDAWVPPGGADKLLAIRPDAEIRILPGAAHCPMETHTEAFAQLVLDWLAQDTPLNGPSGQTTAATPV